MQFFNQFDLHPSLCLVVPHKLLESSICDKCVNGSNFSLKNTTTNHRAIPCPVARHSSISLSARSDRMGQGLSLGEENTITRQPTPTFLPGLMDEPCLPALRLCPVLQALEWDFPRDRGPIYLGYLGPVWETRKRTLNGSQAILPFSGRSGPFHHSVVKTRVLELSSNVTVVIQTFREVNIYPESLSGSTTWALVVRLDQTTASFCGGIPEPNECHNIVSG